MSVNELKDTVNWFKEAVPNPTQSNLSVQIGCHLEEVAEMTEALGYKEGISAYVHNIADKFKAERYQFTVDKIELLDALADQIVTAVGIAHMLGMDIVGALEEVNRSNYSKFEDGKPVFKPNGKIGKGKFYTEPNLKPFI